MPKKSSNPPPAAHMVFPRLDGTDLERAREVVAQRMSTLGEAFSAGDLAVLRRVGLLPVAEHVLDDMKGGFPELSSGPPIAEFAQTMKFLNEMRAGEAEERAEKIGRVLKTLVPLELVPASTTDAFSARDGIRLLFAGLRHPLMGYGPRPRDEVRATAGLATFLLYISHLLDNGSPEEWDDLCDAADGFLAPRVMKSRAAVVATIEEELRELYDELPPRPLSIRFQFGPDGTPMKDVDLDSGRPSRRTVDIPDEDWSIAVDSLREHLIDIDVRFSELDEACVRRLLGRADPSQRNALKPPYIAAAMALRVAAFDDAVETGETIEEASRRMSNVFRNARAAHPR